MNLIIRSSFFRILSLEKLTEKLVAMVQIGMLIFGICMRCATIWHMTLRKIKIMHLLSALGTWLKLCPLMKARKGVVFDDSMLMKIMTPEKENLGRLPGIRPGETSEFFDTMRHCPNNLPFFTLNGNRDIGNHIFAEHAWKGYEKQFMARLIWPQKLVFIRENISLQRNVLLLQNWKSLLYYDWYSSLQIGSKAGSLTSNKCRSPISKHNFEIPLKKWQRSRKVSITLKLLVAWIISIITQISTQGNWTYCDISKSYHMQRLRRL